MAGSRQRRGARPAAPSAQLAVLSWMWALALTLPRPAGAQLGLGLGGGVPSLGALQPGTPALQLGPVSIGVPAAGPAFGWLFPVSRRAAAAPSVAGRGNCVVYEGQGSETLQQVSTLFQLPFGRVLADNQAVVTSASTALGGRSVLLCGQSGQPAPRPMQTEAAPRSGPDAPAGAAATPAVRSGAGGTAAAARPVHPQPARPPPVAPLVPPADQRQALLSLKTYLDPEQQALMDWAPQQVAPESRVAIISHCGWTYVTCDANGNVVRLNMVYLGLEGKLPPGSVMKNLPHLSQLFLGGNQLKGGLPADWGSLRLSELYLNDNLLSGTLPAAWNELSSLTVLSLPYNELTGALPPSWGRGLTRLKELKLNNNKLSGRIPLTYASGLGALQTITVWNNKGLDGCVPEAWRGKGATGKGFFQAPNGHLSEDIKVATLGTSLTGFCGSRAPAASGR